MAANPFDMEYRLLQADFVNTILQPIEEAQPRRVVVLKHRGSEAFVGIDFNLSLTGRTESEPNLQATPGNPLLDGTMDGERTLTMERLKEIMEPLMNYKPMRIISGAPLVGPDEVLHHKEDNVFWIGAEAEKKLLALGEPPPAPHSVLTSLRGVKVEPFGPFADHPALWWRHIATGHARCEVAGGR